MPYTERVLFETVEKVMDKPWDKSLKLNQIAKLMSGYTAMVNAERRILKTVDDILNVE